MIHSINVHIAVEAGGSTVVTETIDYDFGTDERHGIFRIIPVRFHYDETYDRIYPLRVLSVSGSPGTPDQFEVEHEDGKDKIRIGDPDRTISGRHQYTITYRVEGALNGFAGHDELYWNAVGPEWEVPIAGANATVTAPAPFTRIACFSGPEHSTLPCPRAVSEGNTARFSASNLAAYHGLTVVAGLPKGAVLEPRPVLDERWNFFRAFEVTPFTLGASGGLLVLVLAGFARLIWKEGRDRRWAGSAVEAAFGSADGEQTPEPLFSGDETPVQYEPPDGLLPGQVGTLIDESANPLDATATIVDLAVRGYLKIEEVPKEGWFGKQDWKITKLKDADGLRNYESLLHRGLFQDGDEVQLSDLRNTFATRLKNVQNALYEDAVDQGWFRARPDRVRNRWTFIGAAVLALGAAAMAALAAFTHLGLLGIPLVIGGLLLVVGARWMPHRTARGTAVLRRVQGFRRFIEESEKERARFAENKNLFSQYLPYAVVFGATKKWARAFAGLDGELPETSWYAGSRPFRVGSFSDSMDDFTVTTSGTIVSTPSSSGSSGFSGGSSGGGGGGGGGGSW